MKNLKKTILTLLIIALNSCSTAKSDNFSWGYVIDGIYENKFFGFNWQLPQDWVTDDTFAQKWAKSSYPEMERLAESLYKTKLDMKMNPEEVKVTKLFELFKFNSDHVGVNSNIAVIAENLAAVKADGVQGIDEYMNDTLNDVKVSPQMSLQGDDYENDRIGGTKFYKISAIISESNRKVFQRYYTTEINGFALTFILSAPDKEGLAELETILRELSF